MIEIILILGMAGFACYFLFRKFKKTDEKLHSDRAVREAQMLAAAQAWRNSRQAQDNTGHGQVQE